MTKIAAIGEVMIELSPSPSITDQDHKLLSVGYAGDTFNTAIYLARLGIETSYVTMLGDDPYSENIIKFLTHEEVGTQLIQQLPAETPGLYIIKNSSDGERSFYYWRDHSPATKIFSDKDLCKTLFIQLERFEYLYLSGITLAIICPEGRERLFDFLSSYREKGGIVIFDNNYRPRLWSDKTETRGVIKTMMALTDVALLTLEDEQLLWGIDRTDECLSIYSQHNISEIVIKRGPKAVIAQHKEQTIKVQVSPVPNLIDTTGAGDTFNAGYIASRLQGLEIEEAIIQANKCASQTIQQRGAIVDAEQFKRSLNKPTN